LQEIKILRIFVARFARFSGPFYEEGRSKGGVGGEREREVERKAGV